MYCFWLVVIIICGLATIALGISTGIAICNLRESVSQIYCFEGHQLSNEFKDLLERRRKARKVAWIFLFATLMATAIYGLISATCLH